MNDCYEDDEETCDNCEGEGVFISCCDDMCIGLGYCIHGDGEEICPVCDGDGVIRHWQLDLEQA